MAEEIERFRDWIGALDLVSNADNGVVDDVIEGMGISLDKFEVALKETAYTLVDCGCCGSMHPIEFGGDCRDDENRYGDAEDYATRNHVNLAHVEVIDNEDEE
jgi:hypothetical protein